MEYRKTKNWHTLYGFEFSADTLLSPPHLVIGVGLLLILFAPVQSEFRKSMSKDFFDQIPGIFSLIHITVLLNFATHYFNPLAKVYPILSYKTELQFIGIGAGVGGMMIQTVFIMGGILYYHAKGRMVPGVMTALFTVNAFLLSFMEDHYIFILPMIFAGILCDVLFYYLKPSFQNLKKYCLFAFLVPVIFNGIYMLTVHIYDTVWWSVHAQVGSVLVCGICGLLLSFLITARPISKKI